MICLRVHRWSQLIKSDPGAAFGTVGLAVLAGIVAWTIFGVLTFQPLAFALKPAMALAAGKLKRRETPRSSSKASMA